MNPKTVRQAGPAQLINLPVMTDPRGDLTFVEGSNHVPFDIARVYYIYNVPVDSERGGHAHLNLRQVIFALSGSFRVTVDDGKIREDYWLRNPRQGILVDQLIWREMNHFSQGAVCMVLASHPYDENDYIRDYDTFVQRAEGS